VFLASNTFLCSRYCCLFVDSMMRILSKGGQSWTGYASIQIEDAPTRNVSTVSLEISKPIDIFIKNLTFILFFCEGMISSLSLSSHYAGLMPNVPFRVEKEDGGINISNGLYDL